MEKKIAQRKGWNRGKRDEAGKVKGSRRSCGAEAEEKAPPQKFRVCAAPFSDLRSLLTSQKRVSIRWNRFLH